MKKTYLMTPGPTEVPPDTLLEMARPVYHHRTERFEATLAEVTRLLKELLGTSGEVFVIAGTGTAAMEACIANSLGRGDRAICVRGGKFGDRWSKICEAFGIVPVHLDIEWGDAVDPDEVGRLLERSPGVKAVCVQLCETSTAALTDVEAIGQLTRDSEALLVVDGVSSVGAVEFRMDAWHVDLVAVGSQKALMMPPGLAVVAAGDRAMGRVRTRPSPAFYLDLDAAKAAADQSSTPYTAPVTLVEGFLRSLRQIMEEGVEAVWARHARLGRALRAGVRALGLEVFASRPADCVTAVRVPEDVDGGALVADIEATDGVKFAGGQAHLKGKIIRVSTMGYAGPFDVIIALAALEMGLTRAGHALDLGAGVRAAEAVFLEG
ncbi:MAG: pyridoxal-phosphate-dependent aminotransferase family protein [Planctomycetota bacterium]